mmetsp:Transcript_29955/g.63524  ORF Transcript_29955/g.63524 Transcript_29955/m.63524 type:complete len:703 (+) Transcript_29955:135-2243(+)
MSLDAFISGKSAITASGSFAPNLNQNDQKRVNENKLDWGTRSSGPSSHGHGGDEEDAGDGDDGNNNIILAERTSNLISSYRDFISGQEDEEMMITRTSGAGSSAGSSSSASPNRRTNRSFAGDGGAAPLLREWNNINQTTSRCELELDELYDDNDTDSCDKKYRYGHPIYRSKRFKRLAVGVLVALAIIGCVAVATKEKKENGLPDWDEELKEVLLEEQEEHQEELPHQNIGISDNNDVPSFTVKEDDESEDVVEGQEEDSASVAEDDESQPAAGIESITRNILCCSSNPDDNSHSQPGNNDNSSNSEQTNLSTNQAAAGYARAESHHPRWFDRSSGWNGSTYQEALTFCTSLGEGDRELCPYEVYCPTGPHHIPLGGYKEGENDNGSSSHNSGSSSSRAPISDYPNGWVQVGSKNPCVQYTLLDPESDGNTLAETKADVILDEILKEESESKENVEEDVDQDNKEKESGAIVTEIMASASAAANDNEQQAVGLVKETYVPADVTVKPGPSSMTEELVAKAKDQGQAAVVTPTMPNNDEASKPEASVQESVSQNPSSNTSTATTTNQLDLTNILHQKFKPLWLSKAEGWNGGSHADAIQFCASIRGKKLCPYSAMCPHGPKHAVMGGRHRLEYEVEGEQYAPVMGGENHWVMIGNMMNDNGGDTGTTAKCMTHRQLEGRAPEWGLNGDRNEVKQHVMCCTIS